MTGVDEDIAIGEATGALSRRSEPLEAAVGGVGSRTRGTLPIFGLKTDSKMEVVVGRGEDIRLQEAWGRYEGSRGRGQRSRGPRAFFYQTRENQVQRCQYTCKSNTASRPSLTIRKQNKIGMRITQSITVIWVWKIIVQMMQQIMEAIIQSTL